MQLSSILFLVLLCYCSVVADHLLASAEDNEELEYSFLTPNPLMVVKHDNTNLVDNEEYSAPGTGRYPVPIIVELSDVAWLSGDVNIIFPNEELHIAPSNEIDAEYGPCQSPFGSGHCRHFRYCVLNVFTSLQSDYLPYMCRINSYAGVCCTVQPALSTIFSQAPYQKGNNENITLPNTTVADQHYHRPQVNETLQQEILYQFDKLMEVFSDRKNKSLERRSLQAMLLRRKSLSLENSNKNNKSVECCQSLGKFLQDKNKKLCIFEIANGNTKIAIQYFKEMEDDSQLTEIITEVYTNYGKLHQLENIVNFVKGLANCNHSKIAFPVLFREMKTSDHLNDPKMLILFDALKSCTSSSALETEMSLNVKRVVDIWAFDVRNGIVYSEIKDIIKKYTQVFKTHIDKVIEGAYANNVKNTENIFKFIDDLPYIKYRIIALASLFRKMRINKEYDTHVFGLAYRARELSKMKDYPSLSGAYKRELTTLKDTLPSSVREIIWNGNACTLRSKEKNEYVYSPGDQYFYNSERREVFTWTQKGKRVTGDIWKFQTTDNGTTFTIMNVYHDEYLFLDNIIFNELRRMLFTWAYKGQRLTQSYWMLEPVEKGLYFYIKNTAFNQYMFSGTLEKHQTRVFTRDDVSGFSKDLSKYFKYEIKC